MIFAVRHALEMIEGDLYGRCTRSILAFVAGGGRLKVNLGALARHNAGDFVVEKCRMGNAQVEM